MNSVITTILQLDGAQVESILNLLISLSVLGIYFIPVSFIAADILNRYKNKFIAFSLILIAALTLPIFIFAYILFRKSSTAAEDNDIQKDLVLTMINSKASECPKCHNLSHNNHKYCNKCGLFLRPECRSCSFPVALDWKFCVNCGKHNLIYKQREVIKEIKAKKLANALVNKIAYLNH